MVLIKSLQVLDGYSVRFSFTDGTERTIDLDRYLVNSPYYDALRADPALFRAAYVESGAIVWPNEADIDPTVLYLGLRPSASEEEYQDAKAAHVVEVTR